MKYLLLFIVLNYTYVISAQETHVIEPSQLEVRYKVKLDMTKNPGDLYILRCGKNVSEYFSFYTLRRDSLMNSSDKSAQDMILDEDYEAAIHRDEPNKQLPESPGCSDYLYRYIKKGKLVSYSPIFDTNYRIEENTPFIDWKINEDSTLEVCGYKCYYAQTDFRGRKWQVWFTSDIPLSIGPWKLGGLPGLILKAECTNYIHIDAIELLSKNLSPVTFYNFYKFKFEDIDRLKFLRVRNNPKSYPSKTRIIPTMELK